MPLQKPLYAGEIIESATDPVLDSAYTITAESKWLDISNTPALLKERNASNTAWNIAGAASGIVTITVSPAADEWTGTVSSSAILTTSEVSLTCQKGTATPDTYFLPNITAVNTGSFDWRVASFKKITSGTIILHWIIN